MKNSRLLAGLLAAALLTPVAFAQDNSVGLLPWLNKARRGNGVAQYNLGLAYAEGRGVTVDPVEAYVWLSLARENGARGRALDTLTSALDRGTLDVAQRRLAERKVQLGATAPAARPLPTSPQPESVPVVPVSMATPASTAADDVAAHMQNDRDQLSARLTAVTNELATLRTERERLQKLTVEQEKVALSAEARAASSAAWPKPPRPSSSAPKPRSRRRPPPPPLPFPPHPSSRRTASCKPNSSPPASSAPRSKTP